MYNPNITGYSDEAGSFLISLAEAKTAYGSLPSSYHLLSPSKPAEDGDAEKRDPNRVLNLDLGYHLTSWLAADKKRNLKPFVADFFSGWHRDYQKEFGITVTPLQNLHDPQLVAAVLAENQASLAGLSSFDPRVALLESGVFKKDTLNSIAPEKVIAKGLDAIAKKLLSGSTSPGLERLRSRLSARQVLERLPVLDRSRYPLPQYLDEIAATLCAVDDVFTLTQCDRLRHGDPRIRFSYAPRDFSYLQLGRFFGDCTSDKRYLQNNCQTENIYWTVFSWIMDGNYQILMVTVDGKPAMKCHLLPLFVDVPQTGREIYPCLFIDAIETTAQFRTEENSIRETAEPIMAQAFDCLLAKVREIADRMGIEAVYSERFSNTAWVRQALERLPEIYLDTKRIVKVDELEDVYCCADRFCREHGFTPPAAVFMEIQARNTYLISETIIGSNKSFGVVRGEPQNGLPAKYAFGV
jgi:hypothetical protein